MAPSRTPSAPSKLGNEQVVSPGVASASSANPNAGGGELCELVTPDRRRLFARRWGNRDSDYVFVVVHGLGEHAGQYERLAEQAMRRGQAVLAYDQHGHGWSPGRRGDVGTIETLVADIDTALKAAAENFPSAKPVLMAHSMGGNITLNYLMRDLDREPPPAILTNPMILPPKPPTRPQLFAAWLTGKIIPRFRVRSPADPQKLTQDVEVLKQLAADPMMHNSLSIGLGTQLLTSGQWLLDHTQRLRSPVLVLLGGDDELTDQRSTETFTRQCRAYCEVFRFAGLRHSLLLELQRQQVYDAIFAWISGDRMDS